ncbi:TPA: hypothetical protein QCY85_005516 [Bacillus cereus]|nr:hypothetical protein [Bacillus cereus]HDR8117884.1 hypothetical protein [Bacillus cereus]
MKKVAIEHDIVLFFGDNLSDFTGFDEKSVQGRNQSISKCTKHLEKSLFCSQIQCMGIGIGIM